jgi:subtilase family serine protease
MALGAAAATLVVAGLAPTGAAARPFDKVLSGAAYATPPTTAQCLAIRGIACYSPGQFQRAYDMGPLYSAGLTGAGRTIAVVDSFGSPTVAADLAQFDSDFGLPAPPSLQVVQPAGPVPAFDPTNDDMVNWAFETSLDVQYAHAMAPGANILVVETPVSETEGTVGFPEIVASENYVINHNLADVISQSFGATEATFPNAGSVLALRTAFSNALAHQVTVLGASGDAGPTDFEADLTNYFPFRVNSWPSTDPLVTSVGGTQLHLDATGARTQPDNVWNDTALFGSPAASGGGVSAIFARPGFQSRLGAVVGSKRGTPDISMSAAVDGAALVYLGFPGVRPGYRLVGGTSEAAPLFSGVVAVADQAAGRRLGWLNPGLYDLRSGAPGIPDVTLGDTTVTFPQGGTTITVPGFPATLGYDLATGLGTADGAQLASELAGVR